MAAFAGRDFRMKYSSTAIAGARADKFSITKSAIDITDKDDAGIITKLDDYGTWGCSMEVSGVLIGTTLSTLMLSGAGTQLVALTLEWGALGTFSGTFFISEFSSEGEDGDNPATFSCKMESSGDVTFA